MHPLVLAITGASGAVYAIRLLEVLLSAGHSVHLTISPAGQMVLDQELDISVDLEHFSENSLLLNLKTNAEDNERDRSSSPASDSNGDRHVVSLGPCNPGRILYHQYQDFRSPIASGSSLTSGMVVCPCSGTTLGAIAHGSGGNLIQRAADVHLKEKRKLILVPRETPLSVVQLENMKLASQAGAVVLPAMPGWYHGVTSLQDLVDFIVSRILDQLGIEHALMHRWGATEESGDSGQERAAL